MRHVCKNPPGGGFHVLAQGVIKPLFTGICRPSQKMFQEFDSHKEKLKNLKAKMLLYVHDMRRIFQTIQDDGVG